MVEGARPAIGAAGQPEQAAARESRALKGVHHLGQPDGRGRSSQAIAATGAALAGDEAEPSQAVQHLTQDRGWSGEPPRQGVDGEGARLRGQGRQGAEGVPGFGAQHAHILNSRS
jgi:hypothetical protein